MANSPKEGQKYTELSSLDAGRLSTDLPFTQPQNHAQSPVGGSPTTSIIRSPWCRKPDPDRLKHVQIDDRPVAYPEEDDVELGGDAAGPKEKKRICGFSKSTFIIILFFVIVIIAAAIGGAVGGSIFAAKT